MEFGVRFGSARGNTVTIEAADRILLTGAGFTHTFGTPLASEMWREVFNHRSVQEARRLRELMLHKESYFDFEWVYQIVMNNDYSNEEKDAIEEAVMQAVS
jgi:hypothetical protein